MTELFSLDLYKYALIFLRIGTIFMLMPGFSASYINTQTRLILALSVTLIMQPVISPFLPEQPQNFSIELQYMLEEITIGLFLGVIMQVLFF